MVKTRLRKADLKEDKAHHRSRCRVAFGILVVYALVLYNQGIMYCSHHIPAVVPKAEQGVLDLSKWDLATQGPLFLQGKWEFYPYQFLDPADVDYPGDEDYGLISVPGIWNDFVTTRGPIGSSGFGTYRLRVCLEAPTAITYGLKIPDMATSYRLFVDGQEVAVNGKPGTSRDMTLPQWRPQVATFTTNAPSVEILVHVANFSHIKGGMWESISLGTAEQILRKRDLAVALALFVSGSLVALGIYHILIYLLRRHNTPSLFLGLFCGVIALRSSATGEVFLATLIPNLDFKLLAKLEYLTVPLTLLSLVAFMSRLYPDRFPRALRIPIYSWSLVFAIAIIVLPLEQYARLLRSYQLLAILVFLYVLAVIVREAQLGEAGARRLTVGVVIFIGTVLNDIAYANRLHSVSGLSNTMPVGLLVFVLSQTLILAERFSDALDTARALTIELDSKVRQRTEELENTNQRLQIAATKDPLTSLGNRYHLQSVIEEENQRYGCLATTDIVYSLIYLDLDNFKQFNDVFGHGVGDFILQEFGVLLTEVVDDANDVYRIGGDEFVILLPNRDIHWARELAETIIEMLETRRFPLDILADTVGIVSDGLKQVTCSIGIASHTFGNVFDLDKMLAEADVAMLQAKHSGKHQVCLGTSSLQ
jgi:diguanylate cyclase (GGDEF)-like protein